MVRFLWIVALFFGNAVLGGVVVGSHRADRWYGWDPFSPPSTTTDYHGSGDVDLDGMVTDHDLAALGEILAGTRGAVHRADVDGDGRVSEADAALLRRAVAGEVLPGWWRLLGTRAARVDWVRKMLALDDTNEMSYRWAYRQCLGFSQIISTRFAGAPSDLFHSLVPAGQSRFNLPVFGVSVGSTNFGHGINAILVGDDPLRFEDWYFFEPQVDSVVRPGDWNMPYGTTAIVMVPCDISTGGNNILSEPLSFAIQASGVTLASHAPELILHRLPPTIDAPEPPQPMLWEPLGLPTGEVLTVRSSDTFGRASDIHLADDLLSDFATSRPLIGDPAGCVLLDAVPASRGGYHLLWRTQRDSAPCLAYGHLDVGTRTVSGVEEIVVDWECPVARLAELGDHEIHVVWLENRSNSFSDHASGLYWSSRAGGAWNPPRRIVELPGQLIWSYHDEFRDLPRYFFALKAISPDELLLVWPEGINLRETSWGASLGPTIRPNVSAMRYRGAWGTRQIVDEADDASMWEGVPPELVPIQRIPYWASVGMDLARDGDGAVHLVYWFGPRQEPRAPISPPHPIEGRGRIRHRVLAGSSWTPPVIVDADGRGYCPRLVVLRDHGMGLVWDKGEGAVAKLVWAELVDGAWSSPAELPVTPGWTGWYPSGTSLSDGSIGITWSERTGSAARVGIQVLRKAGTGTTGPAEPAIRAGIQRGQAGYRLLWNGVPGRRYRVQLSGTMGEPAAWRFLAGPVEATSTRCGVELGGMASGEGPRFFRVVNAE